MPHAKAWQSGAPAAASKARDSLRRMWDREGGEAVYARCTPERKEDEEPVYTALHARLSTPAGSMLA